MKFFLVKLLSIELVNLLNLPYSNISFVSFIKKLLNKFCRVTVVVLECWAYSSNSKCLAVGNTFLTEYGCSDFVLRIFTGKNRRQFNSSDYKKYKYGHLGYWYIKSTFYKRFLNWKKIFKKIKYVVTGKTPFFVIGPSPSHKSICLKIGFWYGSFVWKRCVFNLNDFN